MKILRRTAGIDSIQKKLIELSCDWAMGGEIDIGYVRELRHEAILINHANYLKNIPVYSELARRQGCGGTVDIKAIERKLMLTDGIYKSYNQEWIDDGLFDRMNGWLASIYFKRIDCNMHDAKTIDDWMAILHNSGIKISYSSGTSGTFSFVPRSQEELYYARLANIACLATLAACRGLITSLGKPFMKVIMKTLSSGNFNNAVNKMGLRDFDAVFLGFRQGRMGNQVLIQELAPFFRGHYFLYDIDLTATALRCLRCGIQNEEEKRLSDVFHREVIEKQVENYFNIVKQMQMSTNDGQKIFVFGAPYQMVELCEAMANQGLKVKLNKGSIILFGGGWKTFSGDTIKRDSLAEILSETFGIEPDDILEGYSMTEINTISLRCKAGRFHIPPIIEPVLFDEELNPLSGEKLTGTFGFLDTLAVSHPGFIISGDLVHMVDDRCDCGLSGPAITEISRARSQVIKGCGGVMGSLKA